MGVRSKPRFSLPALLLYFLSFNTHFSNGADTIFPGQSLSGNQTIISQGGIFELGFFMPGNNSQNYYIGIWYKGIPVQTTVWVANRDKSLPDPFSSALMLSEDGNLVLLNMSKIQIWSTNSTSYTPNSTVAVLLDSGNFVLRERDSSKIIWQSFDHPTDTWLPGGKLGFDKLTHERQILTSWRNSEDPAPGIFSVEVDPNGTSHSLLWNGSRNYWTSGNWTGRIFSFVPEIVLNVYIDNFTYVSNDNESYFTYYASSIPALSRFVLNATGQIKQYTWRKDSNEWALFWTRPTQQCEIYAFCGAYGSCNQRILPLCRCIQGFEPRFSKDWNLGYPSGGCARKTSLQCTSGGKDSFLAMPNMRLPGDSQSLIDGNVEECELACLSNCSCTAYAYDEGCLIWQGDLFDLQQLDDNAGRDLHVRLAVSELVGSKGKTTRLTVEVIMGAVAGVVILFGIVGAVIWRCRRKQFADALEASEDSLVVFKYRDLRSATNNFSDKLGEGGFGCVFKGTLPNSTTIAVKKLKCLTQGEKQFRTEVSTIGTIQHINLVRLRGFCAEGSKRYLVYEYMPNGSLESHLFRNDSNILDWKTRYQIALGTARGLAYLHEKCRDCIIHCDIKPENILLDAGYSPKVADFGLAKLLGRGFSRVLTTMRGTRGYLAPEWISGVSVTPKADVFSYGMMLFEIISGKRNWDQLDDGMDDYFPTRVVNKISRGEEVLSLLDYRLEGNADIEELSRACRVAWWCIQDDEKDRPSIGHVVQILEGVLEMDTPPIPRFLQCIAENPVGDQVFQESSVNGSLRVWLHNSTAS